MRILHIIATLDPRHGGPPTGVRSLMTYREVGYEGEVLTLDMPDAPFLQNLSFPVHAVGPRDSKYGFSSKMYRWLREHRDEYDGFVVNGLWQFCGLAAMLALSGHKPYVVFTHGMLDPYFKRAFPLKHVKKSFYWYAAEYWILRRAYRVLFTTDAERRLAEQSFHLHDWKAQVVPYGVRVQPMDREESLRSFYEQVPAVEGKRYLIYLGRIHHKKGCDLLMQAFRDASASAPDLHLVMAGPDQENWIPQLKTMLGDRSVQERVHWPGLLTGSAKWGAMLGADAFILPSHQENFGIAVAEAMYCRTPVLISTEVNIADEVIAEGAGYVEPDTLEGTRRLIERWIATPSEERARMAERAQDAFHRRYNMESCAQTIIDVFENRESDHQSFSSDRYGSGDYGSASSEP